MRWLRDFFRERDPLVKIAAGLSEIEAQMWQELLQNNGIPALAKDTNALSVTYHLGSVPGAYDLFVKQSDAERALGILQPMLQPGQVVNAGEPPRRPSPR